MYDSNVLRVTCSPCIAYRVLKSCMLTAYCVDGCHVCRYWQCAMCGGPQLLYRPAVLSQVADTAPYASDRLPAVPMLLRSYAFPQQMPWFLTQPLPLPLSVPSDLSSVNASAMPSSVPPLLGSVDDAVVAPSPVSSVLLSSRSPCSAPSVATPCPQTTSHYTTLL